MPEAVIVATARSPIGRAFKGSLTSIRPDDLLAQIVTAALAKVPQLDPSQVEDLIVGCGLPGGEQGFNIARVTAVLLGLDGVPGTTVNRYCSSSLQSTRMAYHAIKAGEGDVFIAAGVECVSRFVKGSSDSLPDTQEPAVRATRRRGPRRRRRPRRPGTTRARTARCPTSTSRWARPRRTWPRCAASPGPSRTSSASGRRTWRRRRSPTGSGSGRSRPVTLPDGSVVAADDGPRPGTTLDKVAALKPVFREHGTVTAGNCCPLNDGAAALVVMSDAKAAALGLTPLARIVATGVSALSPEIMGLGPVEASQQALRRAGMAISDVDLVEINEAFAAQVIPSYRDLGIDPARLNVNGGAIAVGHPFGMTGARIATTLINSLQFHDKTIGLETMCVGGGQGMAMIFERLEPRELASAAGRSRCPVAHRDLRASRRPGIKIITVDKQDIAGRLRTGSCQRPAGEAVSTQSGFLLGGANVADALPRYPQKPHRPHPVRDGARAVRVVHPPGIRPRLPPP